MKLHYSVFIQWSDEDQAYLVTLPEFGVQPQTHGDTYKAAMKRAQEVLETFVDIYQEDGRVLPEPNKYGVEKAKKKRSTKVSGRAHTA